VVKGVGSPSLWQDNDLRCLKVNLVRGRVKPIGNGSVERMLLILNCMLNRMIKPFYFSLPFLLVFVFLCGFPFCNDHQSFGMSRHGNSW